MIASVIYVAMCLALSYTAHRVELGLRRSPKGGNVAPAEPAGQTGTDTELIVAQRGLGKYDSGRRRNLSHAPTGGGVSPPVGRLSSRVRRTRDHP